MRLIVREDDDTILCNPMMKGKGLRILYLCAQIITLLSMMILESFTVATLKKIKADHEQKYANGEEPTNEVVEKLLQTITNKDKIIYINMIRSEIKLCISTLELDSIQLLPVDRWTSAVNSGALKLFDIDIELEPLSRVYQKIKDYNHLLTSEHFNVNSWERLERENGNRLPKMIVKRFLRDKKSLLDDLRALNDAVWLNPQRSNS